jgi:YVTN family beta-propeller protein
MKTSTPLFRNGDNPGLIVSLCMSILTLILALGGCTGRDGASRLPLHLVRDVRLSGPAVRFDYQDLDVGARRLYLAHLGASKVDVVEIDTFEPVGTVGDISQVHGLRLAPDLGRLFASATGSDEVVAIDTRTLKVVARAPTGRFPDGVAYDPLHNVAAVSNRDDGSETLLDARTATVVRTVDLGKEVGNVLYDPTTTHMLVAVTPPDELVMLDASTGRVARRIPLSGCMGAHGVSLDPPARVAFVACEDNARLVAVDLTDGHQTAEAAVGPDPDVLAFDPGLRRLYVAAESGVVSVFDVTKGVRKLGEARLAAHAHSVAVDPRSHRVFFPLEDIDGQPVLRVMQP